MSMTNFIKQMAVMDSFKDLQLGKIVARVQKQREEGSSLNKTLGNFVIDIADEKVASFKKHLSHSFGKFIELKVDSEGLLIPVELNSKTKLVYVDIHELKKSLLKHENKVEHERNITKQVTSLSKEGSFAQNNELVQANNLYLILRVNKGMIDYAAEGFEPPFFAMFDAILTINKFGLLLTNKDLKDG